MTQITSLGFLRTRLDERLEQLKTDYRNIYGSDISIEADDPDGQLLGIFAERISDVDQLAEDIYNSFNPQTVTGLSQSRLVQLNGIRRIAGAYSQATVNLTGTPGVTVPAGSLVKSTADNTLWATLSASVFDGNGLASVVIQNSVMNAIAASIGTLTKIQTPIYGWFTVTNAAPATLGRKEETDEQLRIRQRISTSTPAQSILDGITGAIGQLNLVRLVKAWENPTNAVDVLGLPPHSVYCVVEGGANADIANAIWLRKTVGTTLVGAVSNTVTDSLGAVHPIVFSRPSYSDIYITVNLSIRVGWPGDGVARVKAALAQWGLDNQEIGEELITSRLYDAINSVPGHSVTSVFVGTTAGPTGSANIACVFDGLIRIDASRIVVNAT